MNVFLVILRIESNGVTHTILVDRNFKIQATRTFASISNVRSFVSLFDFTQVHDKPSGLSGILTEQEYKVASVYRATPYDSGTSSRDYKLLLDTSMESYKSFCKD